MGKSTAQSHRTGKERKGWLTLRHSDGKFSVPSSAQHGWAEWDAGANRRGGLQERRAPCDGCGEGTSGVRKGGEGCEALSLAGKAAQDYGCGGCPEWRLECPREGQEPATRLSTHPPRVHLLCHTSLSASQVSMTTSVVSSPSTVRVLSYTSSVREGELGLREEGQAWAGCGLP